MIFRDKIFSLNIKKLPKDFDMKKSSENKTLLYTTKFQYYSAKIMYRLWKYYIYKV